MKHACRQATKLASDGLDRQLSAWEMLRLRLHLLMCGNCRQYNKSMKIIHETAELIRRSRYGDVRLSEDQRRRLSEALKREADC